MGLENDPWLELLPSPLSLTSVFRDGHTHFFAPLWRKRDVWEPINPSCTCAWVSDSPPDTRSGPLRTAAAHLCLLSTCCLFSWDIKVGALYGFTRIYSACSVSNTWNPFRFCALTVLRNKSIRADVWEHLWWVICPMWPWQVVFDTILHSCGWNVGGNGCFAVDLSNCDSVSGIQSVYTMWSLELSSLVKKRGRDSCSLQRAKEKGNKGRQELHFADEHRCRPAPQHRSLPSDLRETHKTSLEGKTPSVELRSARNCAVTWISASRRGAGKKQPDRDASGVRRKTEKNMTPRQYLIFVLSGLCADVIKGETRLRMVLGQTGVVAAGTVKMIRTHVTSVFKCCLQREVVDCCWDHACLRPSSAHRSPLCCRPSRLCWNARSWIKSRMRLHKFLHQSNLNVAFGD